MSADTLISWLFGFTLVVALAAGIYQYLRVKRAQRRHERPYPVRPSRAASSAIRRTWRVISRARQATMRARGEGH